MKSTDNTMRAVEKLFVYKSGLYAQRYCKEITNDTNNI